MSPLAVPENPSGLMPRRQSCDRCHEQKVRCFTNETQCSKGQNDCADAGLPQSGRFISPNPCSRCKRAKATCIYSPQQRSGRPRLPRDTASLPVRKRRVSRRSSSSISRSPTSSPLTSPSITPPVGSTPGINIWPPSPFYQQQLYDSQIPSHFADMTSIHGADYYSNGRNLLAQPQVTFNDWQSLTPHSGSFSGAETHIPLYTTPSDIPVSSPFILKSNASPTTTPHTKRHQHVAPEPTQPWSFESPVANSYLEQLTEINLRLYRVSQTTATTTPSSTMIFPPTINEICNTASSLADLTERYNSERSSITTTPTSTFDFNTTTMPSSTAINSAMDASICLMIFTSHQSILGTFEDICNSFLIWLSEMHGPGSQPTNNNNNNGMMDMFARPTETITQIVSMTNLLSHLLQRLEHGVRSLDMDIDPSLSLMQTPQSTEYDQIGDASLTTSAEGGGEGSFGYSDGGAYHAHIGQHEYPPSTVVGGQEINAATASSIFNQMEQRQNRVKAQMKAIRRWIRKSGELV